MRRISALVLLVVAAFAVPGAQVLCAAQQKADNVVGAIIAIDANAGSATIKTDSGASISIKTDDTTVCLRIPAGEKTLAKAAPIHFADIATGDRVLAHGTSGANQFLAQRLVVMPKAEVEKKREHDLDEWRRRGIGGIVREVNASSGEINLELRSAGSGRVIVNTTRAGFRRYVPGSLRFEDAQAGNFADIKVGDQLRALGDRSADKFSAEEIVSGAFKTVGATVTEVNLESNEIKATTLDQKKPIVIVINRDSVLRRITPPVAVSIAQKAQPAKSAGSAGPAAPGQKPAQPVVDVQQMIDTLPGISLSDLKTGDVLAVTGAIEKDESRLVAIKLAAGVDLVLKAMAPPGKTQVVRLSAGLPAVFDFSVVPIN